MAAAPDTYGIHDISRTDLDSIHRLPRFNMPLELGIFLGARHYGKVEQRQKKVLIFDIEPFRFQKFMPSIADELYLDVATASYVDFEEMLLQWLLNRKAVKN